MLEQIVEYLVAHERCPSCGHGYEQQNFALVRPGRVEFPLWILLVHCDTCGTMYHVKVWAKLAMDDFLPGERGRFEGVEPVSEDDLLDMVTFLRNYRGDMKQLFPTVTIPSDDEKGQGGESA